jgi:hypothetical protein
MQMSNEPSARESTVRSNFWSVAPRGSIRVRAAHKNKRPRERVREQQVIFYWAGEIARSLDTRKRVPFNGFARIMSTEMSQNNEPIRRTSLKPVFVPRTTQKN